MDGMLQVLHTAEGSAAKHALSDEVKETFDLVEPGTAGGGEVEVGSPALSSCV